MKISQFSKYEFKEYNSIGIKTEINLLNNSDLKVILHEELESQIKDQHIELVNEFEPLLLSVDI